MVVLCGTLVECTSFSEKTRESWNFFWTHSHTHTFHCQVNQNVGQRLGKWWRQMRVESSRDVYASAKPRVVFLAGRIGRKTLAEVQKKHFQTRRNLSAAGMAPQHRHLCSFHYSSRENSRRRIFSCLPTIYKCKWIHQREPEYETKLFLERHTKIFIFSFRPSERYFINEMKYLFGDSTAWKNIFWL